MTREREWEGIRLTGSELRTRRRKQWNETAQGAWEQFIMKAEEENGSDASGGCWSGGQNILFVYRWPSHAPACARTCACNGYGTRVVHKVGRQLQEVSDTSSALGATTRTKFIICRSKSSKSNETRCYFGTNVEESLTWCKPVDLEFSRAYWHRWPTAKEKNKT